jgi:hypothetical protein
MATAIDAGETTKSRQRAREERGLRSSAKASADRLPPPPRERKPALAALAVLLIVGGAAVAGLLAIRADSRVPVLAANASIPVGTQITEAHLTTVPVAAESDLLIPAAQQERLIGMYATVPIAEGRLIDDAMVGPQGLVQAGEVIVGAEFQPGRIPSSGLLRGDVVDLIRVADGTGEVLVREARVSSAPTLSEGGVAGSAYTVSLIIDRNDAPAVAAAAAANELSAILVSEGEPLTTGD